MHNLKCPWSVSLAASVALFLISLQQGEANYGDEFLVAFPRSSQSPSNAALFVTPYSTTRRVRIIVTTSNTNGLFQQSFIEPSEIAAIIYDITIPPFSVRIRANSSVVVTAVLFLNDGSSGAFVVSPIEMLSSRYVAVSQCEVNDCFLIIVSPYDLVSVTVSLQLTPNTANVTFNGKRYHNGDVLTLFLTGLQTFQLNSGTVDLTGSLIDCSLPVQVVMGGALALSDTDGGSDVLVEQMPTGDLMGTEFVLVNSMTNGTSATIIKVVFTKKNTTLTLNPSNVTVLKHNSNWISYNFRKISTLFITSSKPVVVELIFGNPSENRSISVASVIVVPVSSWASRYVAILWSGGKVTLVTTQACVSNISINQTMVTSWSQISEQPEYFTTVVKIFGSARHLLKGKGGCSFWGYVTHQNVKAFTAYPIGWKHIKPDVSSISSTIYALESERLTSPSSESVDLTEQVSVDMKSSSLGIFPAVHSQTSNLMTLAPMPSPTNQVINMEHTLQASSLVSSRVFSDEGLINIAPSTTTFYLHFTTTFRLEDSATTPVATTLVTEQFTPLTTIKPRSDGRLATIDESAPCLSTEITTLSATVQYSTFSTIHTLHSTSRLSFNQSPSGNTADKFTLFHSGNAVDKFTQSPSGNTAATFTQSQSGNTAATFTQSPSDNTAATFTQSPSGNTSDTNTSLPRQNTTKTPIIVITIIEPSVDIQITPEPLTTTIEPSVDIKVTPESLTTTIEPSMDIKVTPEPLTTTIEPSVDIKVTPESLNTNQTSDRFYLTCFNGTAQCACHCNKKYLSSLNSSYIQNTLKARQDDMRLDKANLTKNKMTKISLENVEHKAKYVGSTFCLVAVILFYFSIFSSDVMTLFCKRK